MYKKLILSLTILFAMPLSAVADVLILVPGYLSNGHTWRTHGITHSLVANDWTDGGNFVLGPKGPQLDLPAATSKKRFYTVELPSEAPLPLQAQYLNTYIDSVRAIHPDENLTLAGHSAGGVLARYVMVTRPSHKVDALITIASPHSGSDAAEAGKAISNSPVGWFAPMFGANTINRSRGLYHDLGRPSGNNLLGWLNTRQHPQASYVSIVRNGDEWVDASSQDMNRVPALRGRSSVRVTQGKHSLHPGDGILLVHVLAELSK